MPKTREQILQEAWQKTGKQISWREAQAMQPKSSGGIGQMIMDALKKRKKPKPAIPTGVNPKYEGGIMLDLKTDLEKRRKEQEQSLKQKGFGTPAPFRDRAIPAVPWRTLERKYPERKPAKELQDLKKQKRWAY